MSIIGLLAKNYRRISFYALLMYSVRYTCILILTNDFRDSLYVYLYVSVLVGLIAI